MTTVTRRTVRQTTTNSTESSTNQSNWNDWDEINKNTDERDSDDDDKETRLTLMEEVLLLGLKDREVRIDKFVFLQFFFRLLIVGLYFLLERLYFIGFTWLYFNRIKFSRSS